MMVLPLASVAPAAAGGVPVASPPVRAALASVIEDPSHRKIQVTPGLGVAAAQLVADASQGATEGEAEQAMIFEGFPGPPIDWQHDAPSIKSYSAFTCHVWLPSSPSLSVGWL